MMGPTGRYVPLQRKIGLAILATFVVMAVATGAVLVLLQNLRMDSAMRQSEQYLEMLVQREAEPLANELFEKRMRAVELRLQQILALDGLLTVSIYAADGSCLVHLDRSGTNVPHESAGQTDAVRIPRTSQGVWSGIPALVYKAPILAMGEPIGFIHLSYSLAQMERERRMSYFAMGVLLTVGLVLMLVVLNHMLSLTISRPITVLKNAMLRIETEGPGGKIARVSQDEIGDVIEAFNRMSRQLEEMLKRVQSEVSERKQAEEEAQRLRNYLANIIDSMPSILVGVDREGRVTQWNAAAERATGIKGAEAQGQSLNGVLPELGCELEKLQHAIQERVVLSETKVPRIVDGETRYEDVTVYPLASNGIEGVVIRVDDVTERVRIEDMMVQSEKMLSVGGLAAGMAHEINNPLGVILQAAQNILRRVSPGFPANARVAEECGTSLSSLEQYLERREILTFLEDIRQSGQRAAEIVENMLSFSRKAEGRGSPTDLAELLDRTVSLAASDYDLKKHYDFRQIEIIRDYQPGIPQVICQTGKIQQVFLNVLRNGAEAMTTVKEPGSPPRFLLRVLRDGEMVRVEIEDNGPGMDDATRKRVFEPFYTTKPVGLGTGLGLSVSYFIVTEDHGGSMSVESSPGVGTRFIIRLPVEGKSA